MNAIRMLGSVHHAATPSFTSQRVRAGSPSKNVKSPRGERSTIDAHRGSRSR